MRLTSGRVLTWLLAVVVSMSCHGAWAGRSKSSGGQTFLGERIGDEPLPPVLHQLLDLANQLRTPIRPHSTGGEAVYLPWLNGVYRKRVAQDAQALAKFAGLATQLPGKPKNQALIKVLEAFIAESLYQRDAATEDANPSHAMEASAGVGVGDSARQAHRVVLRAKECTTATEGAGPQFAGWTERCRELASKYQRLEQQACAYATQLGIAQPGTFCGDRER
jgi:hypothetical protein